jgi:putative DNA primase/helicase
VAIVNNIERGKEGSSGSAEYPTPQTVDEQVFPDDFTSVDNWCVWREIDGAKCPVLREDTTTPMKWSNKENWISHREAMGLVATADVEPGFIIPDVPADTKRPVFFDFDDVRDPESDAVHPTVLEIIDTDDLYAMVSTSGTGIHAYGYVSEVPEDYIAECEFPLPDDEKFPDATCEVYARMRFIATTGERLVGSVNKLPNVTSEVEDLIREHGREKHDAEDHEPELDREEIESIEKTNDMEVIFDAIKQTEFSDFRLDSSVTNERTDGSMDLDPAWGEDSESGTRLGYNEDGFIYRKGGYHLDALQVVALEEGIITNESTYPQGEDFHEALEGLRNRGAPIPEYITSELGESTLDEIRENPEVIHSDTLWEKIKDRYELTDDKDAVRQMVAVVIEDSGWFRTNPESENIYAYDPERGVFVTGGEGRLKELLDRKLTKHITNHELSEIVEKVKRRTRGADFDPPDGMVCLANGVLDIDEMRLYDHAAEYEFQSGLRVEYDPDAECPRWVEFIESTFDSEAHIKRVQEYAGYTLVQGRMPVARSLFIAGPRDTGKSVFLDTIKRLFHDGSVASVTPQYLVDHGWRLAELEGKMVNIRSDIDDEMIENAGLWKEITAGEEVMAERKHEDPFSFRPTAKHIYATNKLPVAEVDDEAFFKRVMLVTATNQVPDDEKVRNMDEKFEEEWDELPGILNWAVKGLERLRENNHTFSGYPPSSDRRIELTRENWRAYAKSGIRWLEQCTERDPDGFVPYKLAYPSYTEFCDRQEIPSQSKRKFGQMVEWDNAVTRANGRSDDIDTDGSVRGFRGISLLDRWNPAKELSIEGNS